MLPSRLPDLPPEIWEYILHFVPEPVIPDIKLVSYLLRAGGGSKMELNERLRIPIHFEGQPSTAGADSGFHVNPIPLGTLPGWI